MRKVVAGTTDTVMQFRVSLPLNAAIADAIIAGEPPAVTRSWTSRPRPMPIGPLPSGVCPAPPPLTGPTGLGQTIVRQLTLNEVIGPGGPLELVLNNTKYNGSL